MPAVGQWGPEEFIDRKGRPVPGVTVRIYETDGTTLASLYNSQTGATALANPLPIGVATTAAGVDVRGNGSFYAEPGPYVIAVSYGGSEVYRSPITVGEDDDTSGSGTIRIEDEGVAVVAAASGVNFAGAGVSVSDAGAGEALVTIPGGGGVSAGDTSVTVTGSAVEVTKPQPIYDATGTTILGYVGEGDPAGEPGSLFLWLGDAQVPADFDAPMVALFASGDAYMQNASASNYVLLNATGDLVVRGRVLLGGFTGAPNGIRFVGGNATGPPTAGTHQPGFLAWAEDGVWWYCTAGGTPGTWVAIGADKIPASEKGAALGVVPLDAGSKIATTYLPPLAINEVFTVVSQAAMLALTAQRGDVALRTDLNPDGWFMLTTDAPGTLADWVQITAAGAVSSVDGQTGAVSLAAVYDAIGAAAAAQAAAIAASQPLDADLSDIAAIADAQGDIIIRGAAGWERLAKSATATDVLAAGASQPGWVAAPTSAMVTIAETVLGAATATIDWTSIPATYRHLRIVIAGKAEPSGGACGVTLRLNNDSAGNYHWTATRNSGSALTAASATSATWANLWRLGDAGALTIDLSDYASTAHNKIMQGGSWGNNGGSLYHWQSAGRWLSDTAINRVTLISDSQFAIGSTFTLYGLKGA